MKGCKHIKKQIIASKIWVAIGIFGALIFLSTAVACIVRSVLGVIGGNFSELVFSVIAVPCFGFFAATDLLALNRGGCRITFDGVALSRRGFFFGFKKEILVQNIARVTVVTLPRVGRYFVVMGKGDAMGYLPAADIFKKDAHICFEYNEKNLAFVREFWTGRIKDADD